MKFQGKTAIVTDGVNGIGAPTASRARQVSELLAPDALVAFDCGCNTFFAARHISMVPTQKLAVGGNLSTSTVRLSEPAVRRLRG